MWFARFLITCWATAVTVCCHTSPPPIVEDAAELQAQRDLIAHEFAGTDIRNPSIEVAARDSGEASRVSAAWWGFDAEDSTSSLQASLDSGARVVLVPAMSSPWVVGPLAIRSHTTLVLQEGAVLAARRGGFQRIDDSLFRLQDVEDVTILGYGARLTMRKDDYRRPPYQKSEWRHAVELYGCRDVRIMGLRVDSSGGDGVYLGRGNLQALNHRIQLKDLVLSNHFRQAISVISAVELRVENVEMALTEGTPPSSGIDFEPNLPDERLQGCVINRCVIRSNSGAGISVVLKQMNAASPPVDIRVEDTVVVGNLVPFLLWGGQTVSGQVLFVRSELRGISIVQPGHRVSVVRQ